MIDALVISFAVVVLVQFGSRLRHLSLMRSRWDFLLLNISGATFCGWVAIQVGTSGRVDLFHLAGLVFTASYVWVSRGSWLSGPPDYSYRNTMLPEEIDSHIGA